MQKSTGMAVVAALGIGWHMAAGAGQTGLGIAQALRSALESAPDLSSARAQAAGAEAQKLSAVASFLPSLSLSNQLQRYYPYRDTGARLVDGVIIPTQGTPTNDNVAAAQFSLNVFSGGKDLANYRSAVHGLESADLDVAATLEKLFQEVLKDFVAASTDELKIESQIRVLRLDEELLELTQQRLQGQLASRIDLIKAQQQKLSARTQLTQLRQQQATDLESLYADMGLVQSQESPPVLPWLPPAPEVETIESSVHTDPEVESALAGVVAAERKVDAARAGNYPTVALTAQYDFFGESAISLRDSLRETRRTDYSVGLLVTVPLSSYVSVKAEVDQNMASVQDAESKYRAALVDAANRIADAPRQLANAREALNVAESSSELAHQNVALTRDRYTAKQASKLDIADALFLAEQADLSLATARMSYCLAGWEMLRASRPQEFAADLLSAVAPGRAPGADRSRPHVSERPPR